MDSVINFTEGRSISGDSLWISKLSEDEISKLIESVIQLLEPPFSLEELDQQCLRLIDLYKQIAEFEKDEPAHWSDPNFGAWTSWKDDWGDY